MQEHGVVITTVGAAPEASGLPGSSGRPSALQRIMHLANSTYPMTHLLPLSSPGVLLPAPRPSQECGLSCGYKIATPGSVLAGGVPDQLVPACACRLCVSVPSSAVFSDITLTARNRSWWEDFQPGKFPTQGFPLTSTPTT